MLDRRTLVVSAASAALGACATSPQKGKAMYGLIGKMTSIPGQRDALVAALLEGLKDMPGCLSYVVARDSKDADTIWISEAWADKASHLASLQLPSVQKAISIGRPLIANMETIAETQPVGGEGLSPRL
jgi:quinol monooxygenase YgiN